MKKNGKTNGIIGLVIVTILAIVVIIGVNLLTKKEKTETATDGNTETAGSAIDVSGYESGDIKIQTASETEDGYVVTVASPGFGGNIVMDVTFDKTGDTISAVVVKEQTETEGLGSRVTEDTFLSKFNGVKAPIYLPGKAPAAGETAQETKQEEAVVDTTALADGTYTAEAAEFDKGGFKSTLSLTVADGKITEVIWDAYNEEGEFKSLLSADGGYVMTDGGPTWQEQAVALAEYAVANQSFNIPVDEGGKTDAVAGVSISINDFINLASKCLAQASPKTIKDGTYTVEGKESQGYTSIVTLTIEGGKITSVVWDGRDTAGEYKSYLSSVGEYVMVEGNPTWKEQADALAANVIENQSTKGIVLDESGKTDSVAGVSINVSEFVNLVEEALVKASSDETASEAPAEETPEAPVAPAAGTEVEAISGATISSKAVMDGINEAQKFIKEFVLAK
ncbi:FMN-binding protein [Anaerocolumna sp.]|uniref:FMN-binding protein n=1 Tax=Anaerocolumna sp. TaxID=2041569 RepID=UPI0028B0F933|nr:FMN-binding protein [Anaerocolumna sp.]